MNKDGLIYTILFSFVVTFLFVFFLALANTGTQDIVEENGRLESARAVLAALNISFDAENRDDVFAKYANVQEMQSDEGRTYYVSNTSGATSYALLTNGPGLWGNIEAVIGFNEDVSRYIGLAIVEQNETPGLGGRITEDWFSSQFQGQEIPGSVLNGSQINLAAFGSGAAQDMNDSSIDAITGATRTSEAMQAIVSNAARTMDDIVGGM